MFTGIIEETGRIARIRTSSAGGHMTIDAATVLEGTAEGDSIAVNGTCLTVTNLTDSSFDVDMAPETLARTNLGDLAPGDAVNLERSVAAGARMGGHFVQGHVDATGTIESFRKDGDSLWVRVRIPADLTKYIAEKGYVAIDGTSLTVVDVFEDGFTVMLVPYTLEHIGLPGRNVGDRVNIEVDILAKYVERALGSTGPGADSGITATFLKEHGYD